MVQRRAGTGSEPAGRDSQSAGRGSDPAGWCSELAANTFTKWQPIQDKPLTVDRMRDPIWILNMKSEIGVGADAGSVSVLRGGAVGGWCCLYKVVGGCVGSCRELVLSLTR